MGRADGARSATDCCGDEDRAERRLHGIIPFLTRLEAKTLQAVHPRVPAAVSDRADVSGVSRHQAAPDALHVRVGRRTIAEMSELPVDLLRTWLDTLPLTPFEQQVAITSLPRRATACASCATWD